ncbi:MAG: glycosyltransferase, partial [Sedimentisphaerales bacterium]|nr:glycosyltransferase [Sedimentisphaerales bacterium]
MIIFIHSSLHTGGAEILRKSVAFHLRIRNLDFRICLISDIGSNAEVLSRQRINIDTLGLSNSIYKFMTTLALAKYFKQHQPTIVQSSQFNSNFHTRIAAKLAGVPVVICEEHGIYHWKHWWHRLADRFLTRWCDKIIAVSQAVNDFNVNEIGIPSSRIMVLHNCIDTD